MQEKLKELLKNSYCPYSNYPVAAIVVMKDGKEFLGVNVENASYGATICAERSAIVTAISNGYHKHDFLSLHVMTKTLGTPCFICRQVITEFFEKEQEVICYNLKGDTKKFKVADLCPYPFSEEDLK